MTRTRYTSILNILIIILVSLLLMVFNTVFNAVRIDILSFKKGAMKLLKKSEILSKKARMFDEKKVLAELGNNSINGFYYRFDDRIKEAVCEDENMDIDRSQEDLGGFSFEFNGNDSIRFKPKKGKFIVEDDLLKFKYAKGDYLYNVEDLNLVKDNIGEIELRIKLKRGKKIDFGWSKYDSAEWGDSEKIRIVTIYTIPGNAFNTYRIDVRNALRSHLKPGDVIKKVYLAIPEVNSDEIEIDYIRFITKIEKYVKEPCGETYETIDKELRKVLYANTPLCLKYTLDIPEGRPSLKFGIGILNDNDPVRFRIVVRDENLQKEIFSKELIYANKWQDAKIDFSEWSGKSVEILFETESANGNIAFWSNPVIYIPPEEKFNVIILLEDALRADHMSCCGYSRKTTPVKDAFIRNGVLFLNVFSQATTTQVSCPSFMTSLYPTATGVWHTKDKLDCNYLTLAEVMRNQGFATASFIQNPYGGPESGLQQGFSNLFEKDSVGERAETMYSNRLYGWIEANIDRNFFVYLHLIDPHGPYDPPKPFDAWYRKAPPGKTVVGRGEAVDPLYIKTPTLEGRQLLYDGEIRYNDYHFEGFLQTLEDFNLLNDTLIIFIADHGQYLGEHDLWEHHPPGYIQVLHVPLLMIYPKKLPKNVKIVQPVQLVDMMPTILDLASIDKDNFLLQGDSLISLMEGKRLSFWDNRLCVSEEVSERYKDDKIEWASVFYKKWHMINSDNLSDRLSKSKIMEFIKRRWGRVFFTTRVFNYFKDKEEQSWLKNFFIDIFFNHKFRCFVRNFQKNNMEIWRTLTKGTQEVIEYDPEELERLRALGYL